MISVACPYCGQPAKLVTGRAIYPHRDDLAALRYWQCKPCDAYVGVHRGIEPLGTLANAELRAARNAAHRAFDPLWKTRVMSRNGAYRWLSNELGIPKALCHIASLDLAQCRRVVEAVANREPRAAE